MKKSNHNLCEIPHCYDPSYVIYYKHNVCEKHWNSNLNLKKVFGIVDEEVTPKPKEIGLKAYL